MLPKNDRCTQSVRVVCHETPDSFQINQPTRCNSFSSFITWRLCTAQHVSDVLTPVIRNWTKFSVSVFVQTRRVLTKRSANPVRVALVLLRVLQAATGHLWLLVLLRVLQVATGHLWLTTCVLHERWITLDLNKHEEFQGKLLRSCQLVAIVCALTPLLGLSYASFLDKRHSVRY